MMPELSLNILDIVQNSVAAGATLITIAISADRVSDRLEIRIEDNGCGMTEEQVKSVTDPFYTTRTTRKVGLGVPFFKLAAELTGGSLRIESEKGVGTKLTAVFGLGHIDRMPLGDIAATMTALIGPNAEVDFVLEYKTDGKGFVMDTREFRQVLGGVSLAKPEVLRYIGDFVRENVEESGELF